ncbi:hypothetical protein KJ785_04510 [Patescibacteria group bacterium]|nr:hypothetical protein [Patescibacteria group bacterium]
MDTAYIYFSFSAIFNAFVSIFLGFLILFRDRKNKVNQTLALFSFGVGLWSIFYILWPMAETRANTLIFFQLLHIPACFVSIFYLHFVVSWLDIYKKQRWVIRIGYVISTFFASLTFTPYFITGMVPRFSMRFWAVPGPLYHYYLSMFFGIFVYSSFLLFRYYFKEKGIRKKQLLIILIGIGISFVGGSTNYFLWYNINIPPYGNILASSFVIFTVYAIVRYNLLNIKLIATEGALLVMNTLLIFRFIISRSNTEFVVNIVVLVGSFLLSFLLIRSVKIEIKRREEVTQLAHSLEKANLKLQELDRQKTEFLSIASHQLRTPLSIMKGYIELIEDGAFGKPTKKIVSTLDEMDESNERLVKLVDEFLDITRIEQGRTKFDFVVSDLKKLTDSVVKELNDRATDKGLKIQWKPKFKKMNVYMDEEKVRHVIFNFIDNAIKYSETGIIKVSLERCGSAVKLRVIDNGIGFNKEDEVNFFQKFYRGNNVKGTNVTGTGLGIYVCKKFIENHGGSVWAKSPGIGKGGEFGFRIPTKK